MIEFLDSLAKYIEIALAIPNILLLLLMLLSLLFYLFFLIEHGFDVFYNWLNKKSLKTYGSA